MCYNVSAMSTYLLTYLLCIIILLLSTYTLYFVYYYRYGFFPRRSAVHFCRVDNRGHRLRVSAQVLHHSRGGLRHAIRPAHYYRGQHSPEETRRQ